MAQALEGKPTKQTAPIQDRDLEALERYGTILETIKIIKEKGKEPLEVEAMSKLLLEIAKNL